MQSSYKEFVKMGFDDKTANYFSEGRKRLVSVLPQDNWQLLLTFDNGEKRLYSCKYLIDRGGVFSAIRDEDAFRRVYLDEYGAPSWDIDPNTDSRIVWNNKIDISPDTCYMDGKPV